jgi:Glutathione synthase/Ribosomal protein S6 modification enzyme (glutaminyl transferase)
MAVSIQPLGMNARNHLYVQRCNFRDAIRRADDKLATKRRLLRRNIPTPHLLATFTTFRDARRFDWRCLPSSFVLKPARGHGGQGIVVVRKWDGAAGKRAGGDAITARD